MSAIDDLRDGLSAQQCKALTAFGEARGEPIRGLCAVMSVIDNRVKDGRFGKTVADVVFAPHQFSCWSETDINCAPLLAIGEAWLGGEFPEDRDVVLAACLWLANQTFEDATHNATHYVASTIAALPAWAQPPARLTTVIGRHRFYSGVP